MIHLEQPSDLATGVTEYQEITPELYDLLLLNDNPVTDDAPQFIRDYCEARGYSA